MNPRDDDVFKDGSLPARRGVETKVDAAFCGNGAIPAGATHRVGRPVAADDLAVPQRTDLASKVEGDSPAFEWRVTGIGDLHVTGKASPPVADNRQDCRQPFQRLRGLVTGVVCRWIVRRRCDTINRLAVDRVVGRGSRVAAADEAKGNRPARRQRSVPAGVADRVAVSVAADDLRIPDRSDVSVVVEGDRPVFHGLDITILQGQRALKATAPVLGHLIARHDHREQGPGLERLRHERRPRLLLPPPLKAPPLLAAELACGLADSTNETIHLAADLHGSLLAGQRPRQGTGSHLRDGHP